MARKGGFVSKSISCERIVPGCKFEAEAASEEELLAKVAAHARQQHGVTEVSPELLAKVKAAVVEK
jgi:predicted small metal-binding protein